MTPALTPVPPRFVMRSPQRASAWQWANEHHGGQVRWDGAPFILHPLEVASLLYNTGQRDLVVGAGLLHDVIEKTDATPEQLADAFGPELTAVVLAVTEDPTIEKYADRKRRLREQGAAAGADALAVMAADKVAKVRELRAQVTRRGTPPDATDRERLAHYELTLDVLRAHAPDLPLGRQLEFELWALSALPPITDPGSRSGR